MGLVQAVVGAVGGVLGDQWKDFYTVPAGLPPTAALFAAVPQGTNAGRGSNTSGSSNIISNGSKIVVPEGYGLLLMQDGAITAFVFALKLPQIPWQLVAYGRQIATTNYGSKSLYFGEGMNSSVAVSETPEGARFFHVAGKTEASSLDKDMRLQLMLGHIPALLHPNPKSVLIVGCGAGVTAGTFILHPSIERIVICDIEPIIPRYDLYQTKSDWLNQKWTELIVG